MLNDMLTQAIENLEAVAADIRDASADVGGYESLDSQQVACWADKVLTAVSDLKEVEAATREGQS